jgi:hypothetical protein
MGKVGVNTELMYNFIQVPARDGQRQEAGRRQEGLRDK